MQLELFTKVMEIDEIYLHKVAAGQYFIMGNEPTILVERGGFFEITYLPYDLLRGLSEVENLLIENFEDLALESNAAMSYVAIGNANDFSEFIRREADGDVYHDSIIHYDIQPYGRLEHYSFMNDTLKHKSKFLRANNWAETCIRYYSNGQVESYGRMVKGLRQKKWKYYSLNGELLKEIKFKNDEVKKVYNYMLDDKGSNGILSQ